MKIFIFLMQLGLEVSYDITFSPEENKDYFSQLIVVTEREEFTVPIKAIGVRGKFFPNVTLKQTNVDKVNIIARIDIPSRISFQEAPVNFISNQEIYIQNIGRCVASFNLVAEGPFSIEPSEVPSLNPGEGIQISIYFKPERAMHYKSLLEIQYHNGDTQSVLLEGEALNVNVRLDSSFQELQETFIGEFSQRTFKIINDSDIRVKYSWKLLASVDEEIRYKARKIAQLSFEEEEGSRNYRKQKREIEADIMNFKNKNFSIAPISGEIWPKMEEYVTISFHPKVEASFENIAFCEVSGRENRLPIKIIGKGKGPDVSFSFNDLHIGELFINSPHEYEVSNYLDNKGLINNF
jgi:hydrocephalus-inducing protein